MKKLITFLFVLLIGGICAVAQMKTISGTVLDAANHEPLIGASVLPEGGAQGVATDIDGNFTLRVPQNVTKARITYVGYTPVTVELKDKMTVYMEPETANLDEVVVVAYGTASKESLTGAVSQVSAQEIERRPVTSVTSALEGMAPGVQVNGSTGTPGSSPSILIRGINSVNGTTAPLYVVDGVIWGGSYSDINPNDVESISVLKDAASCALYGAKGANGVVLITTKKAKGAGRVEVTAKMRQGIYQRALPRYRTLGYNRWNEAMLRALGNANFEGQNGKVTREQAYKETLGSFFSSAGVLNLYGNYKAEENAMNASSGVGIFDENYNINIDPMSEYDDTDWWDAISRNGRREEYNVSATGATEKFNFFGSVGYVKEQGYILNNDFERWNGRLRGEFNPVSYLKVGMNLSGAATNSKNPQFDSDNLSSTSNVMSYQGIAPGLPYYMHDWETGELLRDENGSPIWNTTAGYAAFTSNKGYILRANSDETQRLAIDANAFATITLPYGFEFTLKGSMNRYRAENTSFDSPEIGSAQGFGRLTKEFSKRNNYDFSQLINWAHDYGKHHVDAMFNHENYSRYYDYVSVKNKNMLFPGNYYLNNFQDNEGTSASAYRYRTETYMARARYNYNRQYFVEASISRDGSSKFSKDERWGTFWSVGASWIMNKEKFLQDVTWIDLLKLRMAYGTAGNDYTSSNYPAWDVYTIYSYTLGGNPSVFPSTLGNTNLHWEATKTLDVAVEGNFFNDRLNVNVGFFQRVNADLLYEVSQAPSNGTDAAGSAFTQWQNVGRMRNTGWEIMLSGTIMRNKDFNWTAHIDATTIKNKLTKLPAGNKYNSPRALIEGKSRYEYYMPKWAGTDMLTGKSLYEINYCHKFQSEVIDENGNATGVWVDDEDKFNSNLENAKKNNALVEINGKYYTTNTSYASNEFCGTSLPTVYGSFGTNLSWKGLQVGMLFTYSLGGKTLDANYRSLMTPTVAKALHRDATINAWTPEMAEGIDVDSPDRINKNVKPELNTGATGGNSNGQSSRFLTSNSYLAFKNLNVSYELPKRWISPLKMRGISVGLSIDNVYLFTARNGLNPTYNNAGGQGEYFVPSRVYSFELTARF